MRQYVLTQSTSSAGGLEDADADDLASLERLREWNAMDLRFYARALEVAGCLPGACSAGDADPRDSIEVRAVEKMLEIVVQLVVGEALFRCGLAVFNQIAELGVLITADTGIQ